MGPLFVVLLLSALPGVPWALQDKAKVAQFILEQAHWRHWEHALFTGSPTQVIEVETWRVELINVLSRGWLMGLWARERIDLLPRTSKPGVVLFWPNENFTQIASSTIIITEKEHVSSLKKYLNSVANAVTIDSDLIISYLVPCSATEHCEEVVILEQVYKTGTFTNLTVRPLGNWNFGIPPEFALLLPESRRADMDVSVRVGIKNTTEAVPELLPNLTTVVERDEQTQLLLLFHCLFSAMNISYEFVAFPKLGWRNEEGGWTHLLGAVAEGGVDVALDVVDITTEGVPSDMRLTNPIVRTMTSVYLRRPNSGGLRDVVRATFSPMLQLSVLLTGLLLWLGMLTVTLTRARSVNNPGGSEPDDRVWEPTEALLWAVSVLCMQGSPWAPKSLSGCILLTFSLIFALITYNSFAAFITSVLSVRVNPIRCVADLLNSEYQFGYIQDSTDEGFLRTVDDATLRALYYRGLVAGGGVSDIAEGTSRTIKEMYAFFAAARLARRALHMKAPPLWRCRVFELNVPLTQTAAAIPLAKSSPYITLINYWLIRLHETGIHRRIQSRLLPPMPSCSEGQQFQGASLSDLVSAYAVFALGVAAAWTLLILELVWARRHNLPRLLQRQPPSQRTQQPNWSHMDYVN